MNLHVSIIGLGLIGGSIAKALKKNHLTLASLQRECPDLQEAMAQKVIDRVFPNWEELIAWSDLIILAAPLSSLAALAEEIKRHCPKDKSLIVIDVSSVKKAVFPAFETLSTDTLEFLSTHPMAGKEHWGFNNSEADLFRDCCWILSPHGKNRQETVETISTLIESFGAKTAILDPKQHDQQVALISHLPALISRSLLTFVEKHNPDALKIAGPGFQSMTRLARDNPQLQKEIAVFNQEELTKQWLKFLAEEPSL